MVGRESDFFYFTFQGQPLSAALRLSEVRQRRSDSMREDIPIAVGSNEILAGST